MLVKLAKKYSFADLSKLENIELLNTNHLSTTFSSITLDSREVISGSLFVATEKGVPHIDLAIKNGAVGVLSLSKEVSNDCPMLIASGGTQTLADILNYLFDSPSDHLKIIGVTGTNGKTSTNWMVYEACNLLNSKTLRVGTLGIASPDFAWPADYTTPDLLSNYFYLQQAQEQSCENVVFEVSSHALDQGRTLGVNFDVAIYTNLTRDHFDYHQNFENYFLAKQKLFELLIKSTKENKLAIINHDCNYGLRLEKLLEGKGLKVLRYGRSDDVDLKILPSKQSATSANYEFYLKDQQVIKFDSPIIGRFNEDNFAILICFYYFYYGLKNITSLLAKVKPVPGRLEPIVGAKVTAFVDYAHTPDALENALKTLRLITPANAKLWVVFGCGGDRDRGKRPLMGKIARDFADRVVVTSDNPRTENPNEIISDIVKDLSVDYIEVNREQAIQYALKNAEAGDLVLIAGKGHEDYQEINKVKFPFSDQMVVRNYFDNLNLIEQK